MTWSNGFSRTTELHLRPVATWPAALLLTAIDLRIVFDLPLAVAWRTTLACGVLVAALGALGGRRRGTRCVVSRVRFGPAGDWCLATDAGDEPGLQPRHAWVVAGLVAGLQFTTPDGVTRRTLLFGPAHPPDAWRRLRVRLRLDSRAA